MHTFEMFCLFNIITRFVMNAASSGSASRVPAGTGDIPLSVKIAKDKDYSLCHLMIQWRGGCFTKNI